MQVIFEIRGEGGWESFWHKFRSLPAAVDDCRVSLAVDGRPHSRVLCLAFNPVSARHLSSREIYLRPSLVLRVTIAP